MSDTHNALIVDQFTRQAVPYSNAAPIQNDDLLNRIVRIAKATANDTSLDVACGPGLLVCAFASVVQHATGIDLTPAMLDQARKLQHQQHLANITWDQGDVTRLPYPDAHFSVVTCRFAFHHFPQPLSVLQEMRRVCQPGGRIVVADSSPAAARADAFNAMERLRDPSHTRALPIAELSTLFQQVGLPAPHVETYRLSGELEDLLARSFPNPGDADRIRQIFENSLIDDTLDMAARRENGKIHHAFPITILTATVS
ncbi:MAG TPA: class I SAM-dependent methyltransferase [Acidobacteriaceae bacterium]|jgi:ubiquinone/menaquinone biosynthesis C-methylase UbiE|nr:class I SAM-dependent methyltransferase [Acidobacteriaceae bacterium]